MITRPSHVTIIVRDQQEALTWYTEKLGFEARADDSATIPGFRWVTIAPKGQESPQIALFKARDERDLARAGHGTMWVLETDDCRREYEVLRSRGVKFAGPPEDVPWGVSAIFEDLYGNRFNLVEPETG